MTQVNQVAYRAFKTELKPTGEQIRKIEQTMGVCRFVFNLFISENQRRYNEALTLCTNGEKPKSTFIGGYEFSKWFNNDWRAANPDKCWVQDVSSKAVKHSIMDADAAYRKFLSGKSKFPNYKRRYSKPVSIHLPRNNKTDLTIERHRAKIPTLGWVRFKEFGYVPHQYQEGPISVTISKKAGRYFAAFLFKLPDQTYTKPSTSNDGIGVDMGINKQAVVSDGRVYENINKTLRIKKLKKRLKREQRKLSRKLRINKKTKQKEVNTATDLKWSNVNKQRLKLQKTHYRLTCARLDHLHKIAADLVSTSPAFITIEDLNVKGMMKNRHLARSISECAFYTLRTMLTQKCHDRGIELRVADRWYPSSKTCSTCGAVKQQLSLSDRVYECSTCGTSIDRDHNAAINLKNCNKFIVA